MDIKQYGKQKKEAKNPKDKTIISLKKKNSFRRSKTNENIFTKQTKPTKYNTLKIKTNESKYVQNIETLITKNQSKINDYDEDGFTPLQIAVLEGNYNNVKILLENGANPYIQSKKEKKTSLELAFSNNIKNEESIINLLLKYGGKMHNSYSIDKSTNGSKKYNSNIYCLKNSIDSTFCVLAMGDTPLFTSDAKRLYKNTEAKKFCLYDSLEEQGNDKRKSKNSIKKLFSESEPKDDNKEKKVSKNNNKLNYSDEYFQSILTKRYELKNITSLETIHDNNDFFANKINNHNFADTCLNKNTNYNSYLSTLSQSNKPKHSNSPKNLKKNKDLLLLNINQHCSYLLNWLMEIQLSRYYKNFLENEIYDIHLVIEQMKSEKYKLDYEDIENILNIQRPGHIFRLLTKLEVDAGLIDKKICQFMINKNNYNNDIYYTKNDCQKCCGCICIENENEKNMELKKFLERYNLQNIYKNFVHNGFDLINYVILQMYGSYPINDDILGNYFHIYDEQKRNMTLNAINQEVSLINQVLQNGINIENINYDNVMFIKDKNGTLSIIKEDEYKDENSNCIII